MASADGESIVIVQGPRDVDRFSFEAICGGTAIGKMVGIVEGDGVKIANLRESDEAHAIKVGGQLINALVLEARRLGLCEVWGEMLVADVARHRNFPLWYKWLGFSVTDPPAGSAPTVAKVVSLQLREPIELLEPAPVHLLAFLLAAKVVRDPRTRRWSIVNTFERLTVEKFPSALPPFAVYLSFLTIRESVELRLHILNDEGGIVLLPKRVRPRAPRPNTIVETVLALKGIEVRKAGIYNVWLTTNEGDMVVRRQFVVSKRRSKRGPTAAS